MDLLPQLHYVIRWFSQMQPENSHPRHLPITVDILGALFRVWSSVHPQYNTTMLWAACTLGFFGLLQSGEFTSVPGGTHPPLSPSDVKVDSHQNLSYLAVAIRASKTDPFGRGCMLYIGRSQSRICPITAVLAYLSIRPPAPGPLFVCVDGTPDSHPPGCGSAGSPHTGWL